MPELPEVETVRRDLEELRGERVEKCSVTLPRIITTPHAGDFCRLLLGRTIQEVRRRGKYLLLELDGGLEMVAHLGMTGALLFCSPAQPLAKHTHMLLEFASGRQLRYVDPRQFGELAVVPQGDHQAMRTLDHMGPEPLERGFTARALGERLASSARVKSALMNQERIAGIGNIYSDEILFLARIEPSRRADSLEPDEIKTLHRAIRQVLERAIDERGTSVENFVDARGRPGRYQQFHRVYGREGETCYRCGATIRRSKIGGRSAHYCPGCQR